MALRPPVSPPKNPKKPGIYIFYQMVARRGAVMRPSHNFPAQSDLTNGPKQNYIFSGHRDSHHEKVGLAGPTDEEKRTTMRKVQGWHKAGAMRTLRSRWNGTTLDCPPWAKPTTFPRAPAARLRRLRIPGEKRPSRPVLFISQKSFSPDATTQRATCFVFNLPKTIGSTLSGVTVKTERGLEHGAA